ncbi:hypothetical protein, partial [Pedobacter sp. ASV12]|uniref:hypothetical protein n=1 Tax=Pedobacter sp. ASV12 TaxID=2795120 RepID=UPI0018ED3659
MYKRQPPFNASISVVDNCDKIQLTASGGVAYQWNGGDTPNSATNTFHTTGSYIVTITNASGCKTSLSKDLVIDNATSISGATTGCGEVTLTASGGISYQWDGGLNPNSATNTFLQSGQYVVKITSAKGCVSTTIIDVQVTPRASEANIQIKSTSDETICQNTPVSFIADTENAGSSPTYKWFKNGILVSSSPIYTSNDLKNNDEIKCELTSSITCIQQSTKMSNSIIMKIASPV